MIKMIENSEHAVSPVVGVMLMLVVTIIIAAVVSAFASGLGDTTEKAPQADLKMHVNLDPLYQSLEFDHMGGDVIDLKDLKIGLISGDTQCEFGYYSHLSERYSSNIAEEVMSVGYPFQKVGGGKDTVIRPGDKFRVYGVAGPSSWGILSFRCEWTNPDGTDAYSSCMMEQGKKNSYVLYDKKSGQVISEGEIYSDYKIY